MSASIELREQLESSELVLQPLAERVTALRLRVLAFPAGEKDQNTLLQHTTASGGPLMHCSSAMQRRNEDNLIPLGQLILELAFKFPVGRIDEDEDPRSAVDEADVRAKKSASVHAFTPQESLRTRLVTKAYMVSPCEKSSGRFLSSSRYSLSHQMRYRMSVCLPFNGAGAVGGAGELEEVGAMDGGS